MATPGSPSMSGLGGYTLVHMSPGNDSISSGLPAHDDKKLKTTQVVAAVVGFDRTKVCHDVLLHSSSSDAGSQLGGGGFVVSGIPSQQGSASS